MVLTRAQNQPGPDGVLGTRRRRAGRDQHRLPVGRPEPDLHLAPVAPGLPARVRGDRTRHGRPGLDRQAARRSRRAGEHVRRLARRSGTGIATWAAVKGAGRTTCSACDWSTRTSPTSRCWRPTPTASSSPARPRPAAVRHRDRPGRGSTDDPRRRPRRDRSVPANVRALRHAVPHRHRAQRRPAARRTPTTTRRPDGRTGAGRGQHAVGRLRRSSPPAPTTTRCSTRTSPAVTAGATRTSR